MSVDEALLLHMHQNARYLIGVSGGADSLCLLTAAVSRSRAIGAHVVAAHINHNLRKESSEDAAFVKRYCEDLKVPFFLHEASNPPTANIEAWGRKIRYDFFRSVREDQRLDWTFTAHTANDVVETFLMRLLANKELRTIEEVDEVRKLKRPLLSVWRAEVEEYLSERNLKFVTDPSNEDRRFLRNKIRCDVVPYLQSAMSGDVQKILYAQARNVASDAELLDLLVQPTLHKINEAPFGSREWVRAIKDGLCSIPPGTQWRLVEGAFRPIIGFGLGRSWSERLSEFFLGNAPRIELPSRWVVVRKDGGIIASQSN